MVHFTANTSSNRKDPQQILTGVKNIITVVSGKGGVGKSTVSANLALALAEGGATVGLMDADIYGPSVPIMFGVRGERPLMREVNGKGMIVPLEKFGIKLMSIGLLVDEKNAVVWRGPMASSAIRQFVTEVDWGELDYLVIDMPPGTGDIHLTLMQTVPVTGVIIVTTPQNVALADAKKGIAMFGQAQVNVPIIGLIENMAYFTPAELPGNNTWASNGSIHGQKAENPLVKRLDSAGYKIVGWDIEWGQNGKLKEPRESATERVARINQKFEDGMTNEQNMIVILSHDRLSEKKQFADSLTRYISLLKQDPRNVFETIDH